MTCVTSLMIKNTIFIQDGEVVFFHVRLFRKKSNKNHYAFKKAYCEVLKLSSLRYNIFRV